MAEAARFLTEIQQMVQDESESLATSYRRHLDRALERYSVDRSPASGTTHTPETVYGNDFYAVCKLAASEACGDLSRKFTGTGERAFLTAEFASYRTKGQEFASRAATLLKEYEAHIAKGIPARGTAFVAQRGGASQEEILSRLAPDDGAKPRTPVTKTNIW
jgi:hypothetical protein